MSKQCFHATGEVQSASLSRRGSRSYVMLASALLFTALVLMLALQLVGQAGDTTWPGPTVSQFALVHWV